VNFEHLPEPWTLAAELVGDNTAFTDEVLGRLQAVSEEPGFDTFDHRNDFLSRGFLFKELEICRRGWAIPRPGGLAHSIALLPLRWSKADTRVLQWAPEDTAHFTGFECAFRPTIGQRLVACLAMLHVPRASEDKYGIGVIQKARRDLAEILLRYPVLMHPMIQTASPSGRKTPTEQIPFVMALLKSHNATLPYSGLGIESDRVQAFARSTPVFIALGSPLSEEACEGTPAMKGLWAGKRLSGRLLDMPYAKAEWSLALCELQRLRKPDARFKSWSPFQLPKGKKLTAKETNRETGQFVDLLGEILPAGEEVRNAFARDPDMLHMAKNLGAFKGMIWGSAAKEIRSSRMGAEEGLLNMIGLCSAMTIEQDRGCVIGQMVRALADQHGVEHDELERILIGGASLAGSFADLNALLTSQKIALGDDGTRILAAMTNQESMKKVMAMHGHPDDKRSEGTEKSACAAVQLARSRRRAI